MYLKSDFPWNPNKVNIEDITLHGKVDTKGWFKVMYHTANIGNHKDHIINQEILSPLTMAKCDVGKIKLLIEFLFKKYVMY